MQPNQQMLSVALKVGVGGEDSQAQAVGHGTDEQVNRGCCRTGPISTTRRSRINSANSSTNRCCVAFSW